MKSIPTNDAVTYIENNIGDFHKSRLVSLEKLKLAKILAKKNPYFFKAKNILTAQDLVKTLLDAHLSSQEETIFGEFLEGLARFICGKVFGGQKSAAEGIDLEFEREGKRYIVSIKSGPNWVTCPPKPDPMLYIGIKGGRDEQEEIYSRRDHQQVA